MLFFPVDIIYLPMLRLSLYVFDFCTHITVCTCICFFARISFSVHLFVRFQLWAWMILRWICLSTMSQVPTAFPQPQHHRPTAQVNTLSTRNGKHIFHTSKHIPHNGRHIFHTDKHCFQTYLVHTGKHIPHNGRHSFHTDKHCCHTGKHCFNTYLVHTGKHYLHRPTQRNDMLSKQ